MPKPYLLKFVKLNNTKVASAESCAALMLIRIFAAEEPPDFYGIWKTSL
ncbi:hypothetical protein [Nostoc sp. FACHB-892]|nr:hypothetical protein [Nostoc sp. FACHB-892]